MKHVFPIFLEHGKSSNDECEIYSSISSQYGSEEKLDTNDPFWKFIDESKYPLKEQEIQEDTEGVDEDEEDESEQEEDQENEEDDFDYDGDDKNDYDFLFFS